MQGRLPHPLLLVGALALPHSLGPAPGIAPPLLLLHPREQRFAKWFKEGANPIAKTMRVERMHMGFGKQPFLMAGGPSEKKTTRIQKRRGEGAPPPICKTMLV